MEIVKANSNYAKEYFVKRNEDYSSFFDFVKSENNPEIKKMEQEINAFVEKINKIKADIENKKNELCRDKYYLLNENIYLHYQSTRTSENRYYDIKTGEEILTRDMKEPHSVINIDTKIGETQYVDGYLFEYGCVVVSECKYAISQDYKKIRVKNAATLLVGILDDRYYHSDRIVNFTKNVPHCILTKNATVFINNMYGLNFQNVNVNLGELKNIANTNPAYETILKVAPENVQRQLLMLNDVKKNGSIPSIIGIKPETYHEAIERGILKEVIECCDIITDPKYGKTEKEWLDFIVEMNERAVDLAYYGIEFSTAMGRYYYRNEDFRNTRNNVEITETRLIRNLIIAYNSVVWTKNLGGRCYTAYKNKEYSSLTFGDFYSFGKFANYIVNSTINQGYSSIRDCCRTLNDYISICASNNSLPNLYSSQIRQNHDIASRNFKLTVSEEDEKKFEEQYSGEKDVQVGEYTIVVPKCARDVKLEGANLGHCVGSYVMKIINGKTKIYFLRRTESLDRSLVTVEINNGSICQVKGSLNREPSEEEVEILKRYAKINKLDYNA